MQAVDVSTLLAEFCEQSIEGFSEYSLSLLAVILVPLLSLSLGSRLFAYLLFRLRGSRR